MNYANLDLQPGDGTRYTIFITPLAVGTASGNVPHVAIGAGRTVSGGYSVVYPSIAPDLLRAMAEGTPFEQTDSRYKLAHFQSNSGIKNKSTAVVAIVMAWLYDISPIDLNTRCRIIGDAYRRRRGLVETAIEKEMNRSRYAVDDVTWKDLLCHSLSLADMNLSSLDLGRNAGDVDSDLIMTAIESLMRALSR